MLKLEHVSAGYKEKNVLVDLSLHVPKGQLTVIIGPNGCGKTTLIKTMLGLLQPQSGNVLLQGVNVSDMKRDEIAKRVEDEECVIPDPFEMMENKKNTQNEA